MKDILPNIVLACAMSVPVYFLGNLPFPTIIVLGIQVLTGAGTYIGLSLILQIKSFVKLWNWVKDILRKKM